MTETVKKATTRKPKAETASKDSKAPVKTAKAATTPKAKTSNLTLMPPTQAQIAALAHRLWAERGYQHGQDADDWFRAEQALRGQELRGKAS
jgi:hypothetical protein